MKHIMQGIALASLALIFLVGVMSVTGRNKRESEAASALSYAIKDTVQNMSVTGAYRIYNEKQFKADFIELLIDNIRAYDSMSGIGDDNMAIQVDFAAADPENELLAVHVKERFSYPIGRDGVVEDTAVVEFVDEAVQRVFTVSYRVPYEEAKILDCCSEYKEYSLEEEQPMKAPAPPDKASYDIGWKCISSDNPNSIRTGDIYTAQMLRTMRADGNYSFEAVRI